MRRSRGWTKGYRPMAEAGAIAASSSGAGVGLRQEQEQDLKKEPVQKKATQ
jgi:hypothetical protein